jgi:biopolymer transport protein ExbB
MKISKIRILPSIFAIALFAGVSLSTMPLSLQAQSADEAAVELTEEEAAAVAAAAPLEKSLLDMFKAGGLAMYPLGLLSIAGFGLIVYNFMAVKPGPILAPHITPLIDDALKALDIEKAKSICNENPTPTTSIIHAGLARLDIENYDTAPIKEAIEEASAEELSGPFVLINYLSVIGSLAPMVGLLGTVSGMVKAFNVIESEGAGSAQLLAGNISEALITTATGMIVGIPAMFFFFFFKNKYGKITSRLGRVVGDLQFTLTTAIKNR